MFGALLEGELRKICTCCGERAIWKSVKNWRSRDVFGSSNSVLRGRRRDFGTLQNTCKRCVSRGRRRDFVLCDVDVWSRRRWIRGRVANFMSRKVLCRDHFAWQLQGFVCLGSTFSWQGAVLLKSSVWSTCHFCRNLAEKLRFWASKLHFWRKSRRKALFLSFKVSIWRKSRRKASFLSLQASFLIDVSQRSFVFELQSVIFEGSVAEQLCFWASKLHLWRKRRRTAAFLSFKASFLNEVSQKRESPTRLNPKPVDNQIAWNSNHLTTNLISKQLTTKIMWITHQLTTKSLESQIIWHPNHLSLKSTDNQITGIAKQLTTTFESWIKWQPRSHEPHIFANQVTTTFESWINWQHKPFESHISRQPNHLNLRSTDNQITWIPNQLTTKIIWISNQVTTKSLESQVIWLSTHSDLTSVDFRTSWTSHTLFL